MPVRPQPEVAALGQRLRISHVRRLEQSPGVLRNEVRMSRAEGRCQKSTPRTVAATTAIARCRRFRCHRGVIGSARSIDAPLPYAEAIDTRAADWAMAQIAKEASAAAV